VGALVLAGSSGRVDVARAKLLAKNGALAESIRWFGGDGQHDGPWEIPVELFLDRAAELRQDCERVIVFGTSFGSEAAMLTGALSDDVDAVVAFAPSDVVWAGVTTEGRVTSHWTHHGVPLPFVPLADDWEPKEDPPAYVDLYLRSREQFVSELSAAVIPVELIAQLILIAGGDDQVWPAVVQAEAARERRAAHGLPTTLVTDPDAGHRTILPGEPAVTGGMRMQRGGTESTDRRLGQSAWAHISHLL
jgi:dienelactone hydrolase